MLVCTDTFIHWTIFWTGNSRLDTTVSWSPKRYYFNICSCIRWDKLTKNNVFFHSTWFLHNDQNGNLKSILYEHKNIDVLQSISFLRMTWGWKEPGYLQVHADHLPRCQSIQIKFSNPILFLSKIGYNYVYMISLFSLHFWNHMS